MDWTLPGPDRRYLTKDEVVVYCAFGSEKKLDRLISLGEFPRPIPGRGKKGRVYFDALDVAAWCHLRGRMQPGEVEKDPDQEDEDEN